MSRFRIAIVIGVVVVFVAAGAWLILGNKSSSGKPVTFNVTVTGAKSMQPRVLSANQNDTVTINIASDTTGKVHLHGYDIPLRHGGRPGGVAHLQGRQHRQVRH